MKLDLIRLKNCRRTLLFGLTWLFYLCGLTGMTGDSNVKMVIGIFLLALATFLLILANTTKPNTPIWKTKEDDKSCKIINIREGLSKDEIWQIVTKCVGDRMGINTANRNKGFILSSWHVKSEKRHNDLKSRLLLGFQDKNWRMLRIKCETYYFIPKGGGFKYMEGWNKGGFDPDLLEEVFREISSKIGKINSLQRIE